MRLLQVLILSVAMLCSARCFAMEFLSDDVLNIGGLYSDNLCAAGRNIDARFSSTDDVFLAGAEIQSRLKTTHDLFMAATDITNEGTEAQLAVMAGADISSAQSVYRELLVAGGSIRLDTTRVEDDLMAAGGSVFVGPNVHVMGSTVIAGRQVVLRGRFTGDVQIFADELRIEPSAIVEGNLKYRAHKPVIDTRAQILGRTTQLEWSEEVVRHQTGLGAVFLVLLFLGALFVAPVISTAFPAIVDNGAAEISERFWATLGKGLVMFFAIPVCLFLTIATVIGVPLGFAAALFFVTLLMLAWSTSVFTVGSLIRRKVCKNNVDVTMQARARFFWTLLAALALAAVGGIPFIGFVVHSILLLAGLGSMLRVWKWSQSRESSAS